MTKRIISIGKVSNFTTSLFQPLENLDVPIEKIIQNLPLKNFNLTDPEKYIPMSLMYDFMTKVDRYIGPPGITSIISENFKIQDLGDWGDHILSNPNLLHFLQEGIKYESILVTSLRMNLQVFGDRARFSFVFIDPPAPGKEFADAINISQVLEAFRTFCGPDWVPLELQMPDNSINNIELFLPRGDYCISYGFSDFAFIFPAEMLTMENHFLPEHIGLPTSMKDSEQLSHHVEKLLRNYVQVQQGAITDFSEYFNLSTRTIRRHLMAEGTTFSEIKERTILLKALEYVSTTNWPVNEIADCLGYNNTANFIRFFKRCTGTSPTRYRDKDLSR